MSAKRDLVHVAVRQIQLPFPLHLPGRADAQATSASSAKIARLHEYVGLGAAPVASAAPKAGIQVGARRDARGGQEMTGDVCLLPFFMGWPL